VDSAGARLPGRDPRRPTPTALTAAGIAVVLVVYAALAWDRRWIADDGLIVVRSVREILAGHGPVYSAFERAEPTTSTAWLWLLAGCAWLTGAGAARLAVVLGGVLAVAGLAIALDATRRLHRARGATGALVPAGALVVLAVFPFWDYATSGLETGLTICWLAVIWWLLGTLRPESSARWLAIVALVFGLGPLVRPDLALATAVFGAAGWLIVRPSWRRALVLVAAALALPAAYEVFRAGYYGALVPLPALAKSASSAEWHRGYLYLMRYVKPHLLYVPAAALVVLAVVDRRSRATRDVIVSAAPIVTAALLTAFLVRVGGDFMHGRLMVAPTLLAIAPALVVPVRRWSVPALLALVAWAGYLEVEFVPGTRRLFQDERMDYQRYTGQRNPTSEDDYARVLPGIAASVATALHDEKSVLLAEAGDRLAMNPRHDALVSLAVGRLGIGGVLAPLDGIVVDTLGLANPLGARITRTQPGATGHEKALPWAWVLADFADPSVTEGAPPAAIAAARHAMTCGELAELLASVREPMTVSRFVANLTGAWRRTRLVIPADPVEAEARFCAP